MHEMKTSIIQVSIEIHSSFIISTNNWSGHALPFASNYKKLKFYIKTNVLFFYFGGGNPVTGIYSSKNDNIIPWGYINWLLIMLWSKVK